MLSYFEIEKDYMLSPGLPSWFTSLVDDSFFKESSILYFTLCWEVAIRYLNNSGRFMIYTYRGGVGDGTHSQTETAHYS